MQILTVNTGNTKLDEAYKKMQIHICTYDKVDEFMNYFKSITKDTKEDELLKWLVKVLFWEFRYGRELLSNKLKAREDMEVKNDWQILMENISDTNREKLEAWLQAELKKVGVYKNDI